MKYLFSFFSFCLALVSGLLNLLIGASTYSVGGALALIKMAHIIAEARGAIAGTVFSKNTYGAYLRTKVTPVNRQSTFQQAVRQFLASIAQDWRGLTQAQRNLWNQFAVNFSRTNIFGDSVQLTGFNLFMQLNKNLLEIGASTISDAPTPQDVFGFTSASLDADTTGGGLDVTFAPAIPATDSVIAYATAPLSQGKDFAKSELRKIAVLTDADTSPVDLAAQYTAKFGALPPIGTKVFVELRAVNETSGQGGVKLKVSDIAS